MYDFSYTEMEGHLDSETETDSAEPDRISVEFVDVELQQQQQQQQIKRVFAKDGSEVIVMTAAQYGEMVKRQQVADRLYDQLHDERRQRLEISEKCRGYSEALTRENNLVMRYRQLLISDRLQPEQVDDAKDGMRVGAELPETFFKAGNGGEEYGRRGHFLAGSTGSNTESVQTAEELAPSKTEVMQTTSSRVHQSVLESDEAVIVSQPVCADGGPPSLHDPCKNPTRVVEMASAAETSRLQRQLVDEANNAMGTFPMTTTSSTMSRDLVQKVLEQNAKLKQILRKIVDTQGMTIRDFLVSCSVW